MRPSSAFCILLASARLLGFGAALCAFALWVVLFIGEAGVLDVIVAALALLAAWASLRPAHLVLEAISVVSFVPVGFYLLLLSGYGSWIGVCSLAAGLLVAICVRLSQAERRAFAR